jgi:hypothetical protein
MSLVTEWNFKHVVSECEQTNFLTEVTTYRGLVAVTISIQTWTNPLGCRRWRVPESSRLAHEVGTIVSPMQRRNPWCTAWFQTWCEITQRKAVLTPWNSLLLVTVPTPRVISGPEMLGQWKIPITLPGIDPATFGLVAQCFNCANACPQYHLRVPHVQLKFL